METRTERRERERREEEQRARRIREIERELEFEEGRRKQKRKSKSKAGPVIAIIIVALIAFVFITAYMGSRPDAVEPIVEAAAGDFTGSPRINILFMGTNEGLTDTFMVFSYNVDTNNFDLVSIPRDTYYPRSNFSGAAYQKINSVYSTEGYRAAATAASKVLGGVPIHYYVVLEPEGVKRIVDAMGGVYINVPFDMQYTDARQNLYIDLRAGPQMLNGDQVMQYLRYRSGYADGDLGRISAQQQFLKAVLSQSAGLDYVRIGWTAYNEAETNIRMTAALGLGARASRMTGGSFTTHTIPGSAGMKDGASFFFHDAEATKSLMRSIYNS
jgi:LCP family protein required for cell wall assembly